MQLIKDNNFIKYIISQSMDNSTLNLQKIFSVFSVVTHFICANYALGIV